MVKEEFLAKLRKGLSGLPEDDIEEYLIFYGEMIDDQIEDGVLEEEAICNIGDVDEIVLNIIEEIPIGKLVKEKITPKKKLRIWEIILLILGSPIWLAILIVVLAVILSLYIVLWSVIVVLWAIFVAFVVCAISGIIMGVYGIISWNVPAGIAIIAVGIVSAGISVLIFFGCKAATKGIIKLTKKFAMWIKNLFIKREEA